LPNIGKYNFMRNFNQRNKKDRRDFGGRDSGNRTMHSATCDECGNDCEVPFEPSGDKPIYCSNCFGKNKNSGAERSDRRDSGRSNFRDKQMFAAVCDKCGKSCEVPFKPSGGKPIFCSDCFDQNRGSGSKNSGPTKEQFEIINSKLDKILKALYPAAGEATVIKPNNEDEKKVTSKKAVKKKTVAVVLGKLKKKKK